jgi:hypothetical protein
MSLKVHHLASIAQEKLISETSHKNHDLRRIVHHAQLYDRLLLRYYEEEDRLEEEAQRQEKLKDAPPAYGSNLNLIPEDDESDAKCEGLGPVYETPSSKNWSYGTSDVTDAAISVCEVEDVES